MLELKVFSEGAEEPRFARRLRAEETEVLLCGFREPDRIWHEMPAEKAGPAISRHDSCESECPIGPGADLEDDDEDDENEDD